MGDGARAVLCVWCTVVVTLACPRLMAAWMSVGMLAACSWLAWVAHREIVLARGVLR